MTSTPRRWLNGAGRTTVEDAPMGPRQPHSTVLTLEQEAVIVAFRKHTLLPLDDRLYALRVSIPNITRSNLHRCLQRHGISRLPQVGERASQEEVCTISYRLLSHRHCRGLHRARTALFVCRYPLALPSLLMPNYILIRPVTLRVNF